MKKIPALLMLISTTALAACGGSEETAQQSNQVGQTAVASGESAEATGQVYSGQGDVTEVSGNEVTISHGPIEAIGWPAMTMAFPVNDPALLNGIKEGDRVSFAFSKSGSTSTLTSIAKQ